jgi:hypothetical protein
MKEENKIKPRKRERTEQEKLHDALLKKAVGYDATETVEEYVLSGEDGEVKLSKKKITKKKVPPDMTAIKILMAEDIKSVEEMTDEELQEEKSRLLKLLAEENTANEGEI